MRLTSELTVGAPLERTWPALLELGGTLSVDLGTRYEGTARLDDADEDEHTAGFHALGRELGGHGLASATILARAAEAGDATRIEVETELILTGAAAQPGQAAAQAAADEQLARLAGHLERKAGEGSDPQFPERKAGEGSAGEGSDPPGPPAHARSEPLALKGSDPLVVAGKVAERALLVVTGVALGLAVGRVLWRRR